ncbi:putative damage-inducible protein DinB [Pedobacter sp. CAN_A7]|uniref:YfiT family bacillithiol transferase n=1 Tax=Pedobacter sp. CAN_A7 TaxID=2787722 RepID=UPI0018C939E7
MELDIDSLKYPISTFQQPEHLDKLQIEAWIRSIGEFPQKLSHEVKGLSEKDLEKQYRPHGWTIKQVVNHCADSHMNSFIRFKLALTEDVPTIKPYYEDRWAELPDSKNFPVESSLQLLKGLHERWVHLLSNLSDEELERQFKHPETNELISLKTNIGIYAWHGEHHLAHVKNAKLR